ncbi:aldehyde dehydrogenase [Desulforhopalus sp. IMCC35007]|uniref:aldehyde dehydrogenase n=1 Tax=Desulforhopalus sp. IMCC35007 TaxID=2569543 RepID=UPI0010AE7B0B|nr:aldehyde dehydrogenase [Desulforhopalus sp. IMCC35007]TKB09674.1 aldehyde dehydrogenase [Desulforhopalus sp. IMCC35007]
MREYLQFINGSLVKSHSSEMIEVENPYTGVTMALAPQGDENDAQKALEAAQNAQSAWAAQPAAVRATYLQKMAKAIRENRIELAEILASEQAKVLPLAQVEVDFTADYFDYYAGWARIYEGEIIQSDRPKENILLFRQPIGVIVGICPWNFPLFVMARKVAPALLTGNTVVIKPSSETPATTMEFAKLVAGLDLPAGVLNIISGRGATLGETLVRSPITGMVTLTGSVEAGSRIIAATAENITKCSLELGGKAPAIVCADADLDLAVKAVVASRVIFSGQVCNCAERVYVQKEVAEEFTAKLVKAMKAVTYNDPFFTPVPDMSSQVSLDQLNKIEAMVERARQEGAEVLCGGKKADMDSGYFFEPTVLGKCSQNYEVVKKEVFGPVLPVLTYSDLDEAIDLANDCEYGLTSSIYTANIGKAFEAINRLKFGETYVNRENFEAMQGFHAGWRKSGIGGADGKHGLYEYLQTHVAYIQY